MTTSESASPATSTPCQNEAAPSNTAPLRRAIPAMSAPHNRAADSTSVSSTICRSKVERLMTLSTLAVAVCCCSDPRSSLSRRVFSMAMMACLAKLFRSSICLSLNGSTFWRNIRIAPMSSLFLSIGTATTVR